MGDARAGICSIEALVQKRLLLIEDEEDLAVATKFYLQKLGYVIHHCTSGEDGLSLLQSQNWDGLLIDWMLPDISGIEILQKIREKSPQVVFILSARDSVSDRERGLQAGADLYISKPFSLKSLKQQLKRAFSVSTQPTNFAV